MSITARNGEESNRQYQLSALGETPVVIDAGFDVFISGEVSENTFHYAKECGIHYIAAGHHATERYGCLL